MPHAYGRLQFGEDLEVFFRTLIGTGANPNVAAVVVIGIEDGWTKRVVDGIKKTGKPVEGFGIEGTGDIMTVAKASRAAKDFLQWASERPREECDMSELWVSAKCGESDTTTGLASCPTVGNMYDKLIPQGIYGVFGETSEITGAEHLAKARAATPEIGEKWYRVWQAYQNDVIEAHKTNDLSDRSRPRATSPAASPPSRKRRSAISRRSGASAAISTCWNPPKRRAKGRGSISWTPHRRRPNA